MGVFEVFEAKLREQIEDDVEEIIGYCFRCDLQDDAKLYDVIYETKGGREKECSVIVQGGD